MQIILGAMHIPDNAQVILDNMAYTATPTFRSPISHFFLLDFDHSHLVWYMYHYHINISAIGFFDPSGKIQDQNTIAFGFTGTRKIPSDILIRSGQAEAHPGQDIQHITVVRIVPLVWATSLIVLTAWRP